MKTVAKFIIYIHLIVTIQLLGAQNAGAQNLEVSLGAQKNVMGIQHQYDITYRFKEILGFGVFGQSSHYMSFEQSHENQPFYGIDISSRIKSCTDINLYAHLKGGFVNNQFFIITPELETRIRIFNQFYLGASMGLRRNQAALSGRIVYSFH